MKNTLESGGSTSFPEKLTRSGIGLLIGAALGDVFAGKIGAIIGGGTGAYFGWPKR